MSGARLAVSPARDDEPAEEEGDERKGNEEQRLGVDGHGLRRQGDDRREHGGSPDAGCVKAATAVNWRKVLQRKSKTKFVTRSRLTARGLFNEECRAMTCVLVAYPVWAQHRAVVETILQRGGYTVVAIDVPKAGSEVALYCSTRATRCVGCARDVLFTARAAPARPDSPPVERVIRYPLHCSHRRADPAGRR